METVPDSALRRVPGAPLVLIKHLWCAGEAVGEINGAGRLSQRGGAPSPPSPHFLSQRSSPAQAGERGRLACTSDEVFGVSLGEDEDPRLLRAGSVSLLQCLGRRRRSGPCYDVARIHHGGNGIKGGKVILTCRLVAFIYDLKNMG